MEGYGSQFAIGDVDYGSRREKAGMEGYGGQFAIVMFLSAILPFFAYYRNQIVTVVGLRYYGIPVVAAGGARAGARARCRQAWSWSEEWESGNGVETISKRCGIIVAG